MSPFDPINFGEYFIIESITQGTFREWDHDEDKPRFSREGTRGDVEKTMRFATLADAEKMLARFNDRAKKNSTIRDARYSFEEVGKTEHKYMVHGYWYGGPDEDGVDKQGYLHFYDVMIAKSENEAKAMAAEDYGDYNTIEVVGIVKDKTQETFWLRKNDS